MIDKAPAPRGVYAAALTPFTTRLEPDLERFVEHCRWLLANGCNGLAPFGTTGEGVSLGVDQKIDLIKACRDAAMPMGRMIVGTGVSALPDAVKIARTAASHGCEGVLCLPPFYYKKPDESGLFDFFSRLIEDVSDSRLRIYLYHFPGMSSVPITTSLVRRLLQSYPGIVAGLKDSSGEWDNTRQLLETFPGFKVFSGSEHFLLDNLEAGGAGCISASTNLTAQQAQAVFRAWLDRDAQARDMQDRLSAMRMALQRLPMVPALKTVKARRSDDPGWLRMLPPLVGLNAACEKKLAELLLEFPALGLSEMS